MRYSVPARRSPAGSLPCPRSRNASSSRQAAPIEIEAPIAGAGLTGSVAVSADADESWRETSFAWRVVGSDEWHALGTAEDVASVQSTTEAVTVPYGSFTNCWKTEDFSPMEPDVLENKFFAAGIGSIREVDLDSGDFIELIDVTTN